MIENCEHDKGNDINMAKVSGQRFFFFKWRWRGLMWSQQDAYQRILHNRARAIGLERDWVSTLGFRRDWVSGSRFNVQGSGPRFRFQEFFPLFSLYYNVPTFRHLSISSPCYKRAKLAVLPPVYPPENLATQRLPRARDQLLSFWI
jgi:hypothetical protein